MIETGNAASVCAMVRQGLGVVIINPLTALAEAGRDLVIRSISLSVPYRVMLIRPNHRPASVSVEVFCDVLREEAKLAADGIKQAVSAVQPPLHMTNDINPMAMEKRNGNTLIRFRYIKFFKLFLDGISAHQYCPATGSPE